MAVNGADNQVAENQTGFTAGKIQAMERVFIPGEVRWKREAVARSDMLKALCF